jgi:choline dehydrogenase-like flavoprotein
MTDKYDLIIAGTGFASTFFLKKYLEKSSANAKVLVLERGFLFPHKSRIASMRGEKTEFDKINPEPHETYINNTPEKHWAFSIGFGGSSNCWYGCTPRLMPNDFQLRTLYGVGNDWPISYNELETYYCDVEDLMGISGPEETPFPKSRPYPLPPHAFTEIDRALKKRYGKLYINQPTARARQPVNGRGQCCASAVCSVCPVNAKFTIENSNIGVYEDQRVHVIYGAQVTQLDLSNDRVNQVVFVKDGKENTVQAEVFALGTHAIFNAGILLNSGDSHTMTGKGLGEQYGMDVVVYLDKMQNVGGSTWVNANGYMLYDGDHRKNFAACIMEANNSPYVRLESGKWRNLATFRMIFEDLPQEKNFVKRGESVFKPIVNFEGVSEYTLKGVDNMKEKLPEIFSCLPVEEIRFMEPFTSEAHIMGTTRMSKSIDDGVVDKNLIHHQYRNLFVLGSSTFPTFSPPNPTLTISALSLHAADKSF